MRFFVIALLMGLTVSGAVCREYRFDSGISREVPENYLSRAITMNALSFSPQQDEDVRMLKNIGAMFIGRAAYIWGNPPANQWQFYKTVRDTARKVHRINPNIIVQACIFEAVAEGIDNILVPKWVFDEFGLEAEQRCFQYKDMLFSDGRYIDQWGKGCSVPDITKLETKLWTYYLSRLYIDAGYEAIHYGQIQLVGASDLDYRHWADLIGRVRKYAAKKAWRHWVICDAHVVVTSKTKVPKVGDKLLLDFVSFPLRPKEVSAEPQKAVLEVGFVDTIYKRSPGGITPSGWRCEHVPYLVEFDQWGTSGREGQAGVGYPYCWGYEDATWFAHQSENYRNWWLSYAWRWLKQNDRCGHLQMPGSIPMAVAIDGDHWYRANTRSNASPKGYNQEETIKEIWSNDLQESNQ
ncbi:MAG: hypothetical protein HYX78_00600 [Armatimonadetes bacterium]|nr:hypothetical protein [Armatimonadota bacterium]